MKRLLPVFTLAWAVVACGEASPVVLGTIDDGALRQALSVEGSGSGSASQGSLELEINGELRRIQVDRDGAFAVQQLPSGELELALEVEGIRGTLTISEVAPGEVVEIALATAPGRLELRVVRRTPPANPADDTPVPNDGAPIEIKAHRVVYYLEPGVYTGAVKIEGHDVTLIGAYAGDLCDETPTVLAGPIVIKGHSVRLVNIALRGPQTITGHDVKIVSSCRR